MWTKIDKLVKLLKKAENNFLITDSNWQMNRLYRIKNKFKLSKIQNTYFNNLCKRIGIINLINMSEFEFTKDNIINKKVPYITRALKQLKEEGKIITEDFEEVVDPFELILKCYELSDNINKKKGNTNNARRI